MFMRRVNERRASIVREEVRGERREIVGAGVRVPLASRSVELEHHDRAAPGLLRCAGRYAINRAIDRRAALERCRAVPNVQREAQRLAVEALGEDDGVGHALREPLLDERRRTHPL